MSVVPPAIPDVGATTQRLSQNSRFDPLKAGFGTEEYFVWSRFDGTTTVKDLILMTGLPVERAIEIVRTLRKRGAIIAPGEDPGAALGRGTGSVAARPVTMPSVARTMTPPAMTRPPTSPTVSRATTPSPAVARTRTTMPPQITRAPTPETSARPGTLEHKRATRPPDAVAVPELTAPTADEQRALAEPSDLTEEERRRILSALRLVAAGDPWVLLGVPRGTDKRSIKRAFFERSKQFHPDRFFRKDIGPYRDRLHIVFEAISRAHGELNGDGPARSTPSDAAATAPQTPAEYAAELFDRACVAEVSGDPAQALKLFSAAVKLDGQARYLRRAAECAIAAGELRAAEDYAKKAAALEGSDPSTARILGKVLRLLGKLETAEEVLVMALAMKSENDTLMMELASDLRAVRADLAR